MLPDDTLIKKMKNTASYAVNSLVIPNTLAKLTPTMNREGATEVLQDKLIVAGGAFASIIQNQKPNDIDIYLLDVSSFFIDIIEKAFRGPSDTFAEKKKTSPYINKLNPNILSVWDFTYVWNNKDVPIIPGDISEFCTQNVQIMITKYKTRKDVIDHFDFKHNCISWHKDKLYMSMDAYDSAKDKILKINNAANVSRKRTEKFLNRGYKSIMEINPVSRDFQHWSSSTSTIV